MKIQADIWVNHETLCLNWFNQLIQVWMAKKYNGGIPQTNMQGDMNIEVRSCSCSSKSPARMDQPLMEPEYDMNIVRKQWPKGFTPPRLTMQSYSSSVLNNSYLYYCSNSMQHNLITPWRVSHYIFLWLLQHMHVYSIYIDIFVFFQLKISYLGWRG